MTKTKKAIIFLMIVGLLISPVIYQLGWIRSTLENLTEDQSQAILSAYGLELSGGEYVESFLRTEYMNEVFYVIELAEMDNPDNWAQQNMSWQTETLSKSVLFRNKCFSQQRIYIDQNGRIFVSCFCENLPLVGELFLEYSDD